MFQWSGNYAFFRHNRKTGKKWYLKVFLVFTLTETSLPAIGYSFRFFSSGLKLCKSCLSFIHYIVKMSRSTNNVYIWRYLILTYIERFISTVCCFVSYISWSANCMSWVCKFNNFFLTCWKTGERFIFEGFNIVLYGKFISDSAILFCFFYLVCKLFKGLF